MPLYLLRWPDLSAALIRADSEEHLLTIADELGNPEGCSWSVYRGPLWIELELPVEFEVARIEGRPLAPTDIKVGSVKRLAEGEGLTASIPDTDTASEMVNAIVRRAFPSVHRTRSKQGDDATEDELRAAVRDDLDGLVRHSWRRNHPLGDDPVAHIARNMDAPVELVRRWLADAARAHAETPPPESREAPRGPRSPKKPPRPKPRRLK